MLLDRVERAKRTSEYIEQRIEVKTKKETKRLTEFFVCPLLSLSNAGIGPVSPAFLDRLNNLCLLNSKPTEWI